MAVSTSGRLSHPRQDILSQSLMRVAGSTRAVLGESLETRPSERAIATPRSRTATISDPTWRAERFDIEAQRTSPASSPARGGLSSTGASKSSWIE